MTPISSLIFGAAADAAGLPPGVLSVVVEAGIAGAELLTSHPAVDMVSFTGSTVAGRKILAQAAPTVKRVSLELGGKSAQIYLPDAVHRAAVRCLAVVASTAGQACVAATRMLVPQDRKEEVLEAVSAAYGHQGRPAHRPVDGHGPGDQRRTAGKCERYVAAGRRARRQGVQRRRAPRGPGPRLLLRAHRARSANNANPAAQEEIFGPVIGVLGYRDLDEAVAIANDSIYGLSAQVYGADAAAAVHGRLAGCAPARSTSIPRCSRRTHRAAATSRAAWAANGAPTGSANFRRSNTWRLESCTMTITKHERNSNDYINLDWLISVDDHILEPPNLWVDRVAAKDRDRARTWRKTTTAWTYWVYDGKRYPNSGLSAVVGKSKEEFSPEPLSYSEMRPGCYDAKARVEDMDRSGVLASLCFPTLTRFCGQLFMEASDREFGFECLQIYNDWLVEEWCGAAPGRYIPLMLIPMWDPKLAVKEMERMAAKGVTSFAFSENPEPLGLPTIHDADHYWEPVMAAANDLEMVASMHVGSSSTLPKICTTRRSWPT